MIGSKIIRELRTQPITPANFRPYGQVIFSSQDGTAFGANDPQLILDRGTPRFYIMSLHHRGMKIYSINRHLQCTQCLGSLEGKDWLMAVCEPNNDVDTPDLSNIVGFQIPGNCFIKLNIGTWHAGPYFEHEIVNFYNLELIDTNTVDSCKYNFSMIENLEFEFKKLD